MSRKRAPTAETALEMAGSGPSERLTRNLDEVLAYQLRRAQEASFAAFAARVGEAGIWPGWYALLVVINDNPGINQRDLSHAVGRDKSTLTASLRELGKAGLIEKTRDEADQRSFRIALTAAGQRHLAELEFHADAHNKRLDRIIGSRNRTILLQMLRDLADNLSAE
ncbi:MarR family winged helix-turn-helix transcriptional regulator [Novosphingobium taihuense]|uniref:DNA-binding MarR family transcriptional regulator n=1 Tax=Novosphingobium taihuense TaxID=260085 RepID=A0A7W7AAL1_9SPHN|nr:MarR family transcriptional regulator [Novosphingobium taihuense]MBB4612854.1 DNA-binding MarR family transcriptional regulator [Novosphingobium taihuense]TWH81957.1 DNA-binding MarR family transcriptional regulator [Novosphingobium taihuense]